ncbi:MAG: hypothetical protein WC841_02940 [Candidatus Shapirobacteria bacterium]|jgi:hypothetical protein
MANKNLNLLKTIFPLVALPFIILAIKTVLDIRKGAAGIPAAIIIDTQSPQGNIPSSLWQNISQGGEEPTDMIAPVLYQTKPLRLQLIRIDHLFDYYQVYAGPGNYNFEKLDRIINSILSTGAKPMLSVSYTTSSMSKNGQNAGEPSDWNQWYQLVKATANRYSREKNISGIYYEVWNEPDLFGGWHYAKSPDYSTLYVQTARAIVDGAGNSDYKIGGPATTGFYENWIKSLFKTATENRLRLNFISWHKYSKNIIDYEKDFNNLNKILSDFPQYFGIERIITETGPSPEADAWYDNKLSGIHLISLCTQMAGKIHRLFPFELVDGPSPRSPNSTGWGIITHHTNGSVPKPRYYALQFLNQLQGQRLSSTGDGSWVTSLSAKNGSIISTLLVNYDSLNLHPETVPVTFRGISPGNYRLVSTIYMGKENSKNITVPSFNYTENVYLEPNSAIILKLTPLN